MKKLLTIATCAALATSLAACGGNDDEMPTEVTAESDTVIAAPTADPALAEAAGTYEVTGDDGTVTMQTVNADGTYVDTVDGTETERGTVRLDGEAMCYDPTGPDAETCWTSGEVSDDGSFRANTNGEDAGVTIRKVG